MAYTVKLNRQNITFLVNEDESILEAALKQGLNLPYGCRNGECGSCIANSSKIDDFQVSILTPFLGSFWRSFGSPNGGQSHQKAISKKHQKHDAPNEPKKVPNGVPN